MAYSEFTAQFGFSPNPISHHEKRDYSVNDAAQEYPGCGCGDFRVGTICVENADGSLCAQFLYHGYEVTDGKYEISGLPSACGAEQDCQTLRIDLLDPVTDLSVSLYYGIFYEADAITRYARLQNRAAQACTLRKAASACLDIPFGDWELIHFHGRHCMERQVQRLPSAIPFRSSSPRAVQAATSTTLCDPCGAGNRRDRRRMLRRDARLLRQLQDRAGA